MERDIKLTQGNITKTLVKLAIPIMATSFVQMAYNMMDMIWLGRVSTNAVAAAGTAGFFTWFGSALFLIPKIGAEVGVAQSYGRDDMDSARNYVFHTIQLDIIIGLIYSLFLILFRHKLISFFDLGDSQVVKMATDYLFIVSFGMVFYFLNPVFSGIFNGSGNSTTPFLINAIGLGLNVVLDPMMILGLGPFPKMGIKGAALATIISQFIATIIFVKISRDKLSLFCGFNIFQIPDKNYIKKIFKLGFPASLQNGLFAMIAMVIAKVIAQWGPTPIAVQKVGSQIESISWLTAGGFSTALSAFVGQNYGAEEWDRIHEGYRKGMFIVGVIGVFATCLLIFGARPIFRLFIPNDEEAIREGIIYLRILGLSQLFMTIEIATGGAFNGLGKTIPPSVVGIVFNGLRIPASIILSSHTSLGLKGVWWSISMSSVFKGIVLTIWFITILKKIGE
ncbi:MATE family efflux transporter [Anaerosalibacter bizertensis]|uniref:Probable multidrug resistance protein NorM n=2 Tax=Anaerosalibacter bizertensis TaxID=932217 RepID=A0A844FG79_9FIRM|nr:MATE family efflux transporter [Anaerosalibacter bizertensis]MCB5559526.1 MATE family efflux transporter [Anaerosalibacter bizertensis]MSS43053.1 MATE family efflux transporter [Anaerosalibacter bizertensis]HHV27872.1 MATE family efflux transporter [Tissierellia bacterium]